MDRDSPQTTVVVAQFFYPVISGYLLVRNIACHTSHPEPTLTGSNEVDVASKEATSCSRDVMWKRLALRNVALQGALKFIDKSWKRKPRNFWTSYRYAFLVTAIDLNFSKNYQQLNKMQSALSLTGILGTCTCTCTCPSYPHLKTIQANCARAFGAAIAWVDKRYL